MCEKTSFIRKAKFSYLTSLKLNESLGVVLTTWKYRKCRRERDATLAGGRQQVNRKSGPDYSARRRVLFWRRVVFAKSTYYSLASGRPRRCYPEDCQVSAWSSWSSCSSSMSDEQELEFRSRSIITPSCKGKACRRKLNESRLCHESNTQNGQGMCEEFCSIVKIWS